MRTLVNSVLAMAPSYWRCDGVAALRTASIELLQGRVSLHGPLDRGPVAAARQDDEAGTRDALRHDAGARGAADRVLIAGDEQGRAGDPRDIGGLGGGQG